MKLKKAFRNLFHAVLIFLITWALLEVALTVFDPYLFRGFYEYDPDLGFRVRPEMTSNEFGFNDYNHTHEKPADTYRVLVLGDSFSWLGGLDCNYVGLLRKRFAENPREFKKKIEVINAGYSMIGPPQEFRILKKYGMLYHPDLVVLAFFAGNDFTDSNLYRKRIVLNSVLYDIDVRNEMHWFGFPIVAKSRVWQMFSEFNAIYTAMEEKRRMKKLLNCGFPERPVFTKAGYARSLETNFKFMAKSGPIDFKPEIENAERVVHRMREYLQDQHRVQFAVAILPAEVQVDPAVLKEMWTLPERPNLFFAQDQIKAFLDGEQIPYRDLTSEFLKEAPKRRLYLLRDGHWNREGNELAADLVYPWLVKRLKAQGL